MARHDPERRGRMAFSVATLLVLASCASPPGTVTDTWTIQLDRTHADDPTAPPGRIWFFLDVSEHDDQARGNCAPSKVTTLGGNFSSLASRIHSSTAAGHATGLWTHGQGDCNVFSLKLEPTAEATFTLVGGAGSVQSVPAAGFGPVLSDVIASGTWNSGTDSGTFYVYRHRLEYTPDSHFDLALSVQELGSSHTPGSDVPNGQLCATSEALREFQCAKWWDSGNFGFVISLPRRTARAVDRAILEGSQRASVLGIDDFLKTFKDLDCLRQPDGPDTVQVSMVTGVQAPSLSCGDGWQPEVASLEILAGEGQTGAPDSTLPTRIVVQARSVSSALTPVGHAPIRWTPVNGGLVDLAAAETGSDGKADAVWHLGSAIGLQQLLVELLDGSGNPVASTLVNATAISPPPPPVNPPTITTTALPDIPLGQAYDQTVSATGGVPLYEWSFDMVAPSNPPPGLTIDSLTGRITGVPRLAGSYTFGVIVLDGNGDTDRKQFTITVTSCTRALPSIATASAVATFFVLGHVPVAVDPQGRPVVATMESSSTGFVTYVHRLEHGAWVVLGGPLPSGGNTLPPWGNVDLALDVAGNPSVASLVRNAGSGQYDIVVSQLVNGTWQSLPRVPSDFSTGGFALKLDAAGRPVVAFENNKVTAPFREIAIARYNGGSWDKAGGIAHVAGSLESQPALAIDPTGARFVAWVEQGVAGGFASFTPYAFRVDPPNAGDLGSPNPGVDLFQSGPALAFDAAGDLVMAWNDFQDGPGGDELGVRVHVHRGGGWTAIGDLVPGVAFGRHMQDLVLNRWTQRLAISTVYSSTFVASAHEFDGKAWRTLCDPIPDPASASGRAEGLDATGLAFDPVNGGYVIAATSASIVSTTVFVAQVRP